MLSARLRSRLVISGALLLVVAFALRFLESPFAAWAVAHANGSPGAAVAALALMLSTLPTVLQITALSLATAALVRPARALLLAVAAFWAALSLGLAYLVRPELRDWAAQLPAPLWRAWAGLSAGQLSALSHGFGARQIWAALAGAVLAGACLEALLRRAAPRITRLTLICLVRPEVPDSHLRRSSAGYRGLSA